MFLLRPRQVSLDSVTDTEEEYEEDEEQSVKETRTSEGGTSAAVRVVTGSVTVYSRYK